VEEVDCEHHRSIRACVEACEGGPPWARCPRFGVENWSDPVEFAGCEDVCKEQFVPPPTEEIDRAVEAGGHLIDVPYVEVGRPPVDTIDPVERILPEQFAVGTPLRELSRPIRSFVGMGGVIDPLPSDVASIREDVPDGSPPVNRWSSPTTFRVLAVEPS
jgi:hypothetical protein